MNKGNIIASSKLELRTTEERDLVFVLETENDPDNRPFIGQWTAERHRAALTEEDVLHAVLRDKQGAPVGYLIVTGLTDPNRSVCIQRIALKQKRRGYGTEALRLIVRWIWEQTEAHRIWLDVKEGNGRARRVYEAVGFVHEGTLRDCLFNGDQFESLSIMSILRSEYKG
ncbi:GNAT family N-acetyltransferase [Paenibacillus melissococcoides]|uniref:GNAT family N-acetyltransferase n=1 Tax=Paenibacillus melissococcoides TaxID=2912268 RepID=A0ABM9FZF4_9BACL|nr:MULTISPECIES: GNAT family protein [Paenibacillus]MEB9896831.1 GNAT family protein [Bacillus cereus]CAH8244616.1 GNAT family N-acetyltransferase [Paenibacillus melissococcoides]CAH8708506.1 GNAT family N-acetyltransferase [Paenibacillus melissococcoides]CAH8709221.1 GNAT family N-acetyltransferase [Paenibacillus melissococcoides]GIO77441.1 hypothetical protein J6TS7_10510 [Paenibacillus dendritiformis]